MAKKKIHKLGFGFGIMIENGDGTASYRTPAKFTPEFRVRIADVTGFAVEQQGAMIMQRNLKIFGNGTELAHASVNHGVAEKIEAWFRAHPDFRGRAAPGQGAQSLADELSKLAALRDAGVLTSQEFAQQKAKLLG